MREDAAGSDGTTHQGHQFSASEFGRNGAAAAARDRQLARREFADDQEFRARFRKTAFDRKRASCFVN